jgi:outer membrane protein
MSMPRFRPYLFTSALVASLWAVVPHAMSETLTDALITAYQTSPLLRSSQASLRSLDERVPQARANMRPQVDASISADTQSNVVEALDERIDRLSAAVNASLLIYDHGQTRAAIEAARFLIAE